MPHSELGASQMPRKAIYKRFAYDVFLSHTSKDKPAVCELAERLKQDGLRVWFDEWVIQPGDSIPLKIEQGLEQSRTLILVMSQNAFASEWVSLERHTVLFRDPTNAERRFIPLRLDDVEITDTLQQFAYIDWRQKAPDQYTRLLTACRPASAETKYLNINFSIIMIPESSLYNLSQNG
jgi:TIR domain